MVVIPQLALLFLQYLLTLVTMTVPINLILFEASLLDMKSAIDDMSTHLIGKVVRVSDGFRLGPKPPLILSRVHVQF